MDGDCFVVETDDAGIGESDTKDVAGEVLEHGLFAVAPGGDVEDPALTPHGLRDDEIGTLSAQEVPEFAAHQFVESLDGNQKLPACRMPGGGVLGYTAAADQAVNVRVQTPTPTIP